MLNEAPQPSAPRRRRASQTRIAIIGLIVAALLAVTSLGGWWLATRDAEQPSNAAPVTASPTLGASPMPTTTVTPADVTNTRTALDNHAFKSESGNIRCSIGVFSGQPGAICQQVEIGYPVPTGACPGDANGGGVFVGVQPSGAYWPCVAMWAEPTEVLAFDTPISDSGITCTISLTTGATCVNDNGGGFSMEYSAGVTTF